jgi:DNA-binding LacI/PurR family transcriptional regulator
MARLDYFPNLVAASLRRNKTGTIGLIIPDISNLFFAFLVKSFENILSLNNYNIIVSNTLYNVEKETEILNILRSKRVDGILIVPENEDPQPIENVIKSGIPVCTIEREIPEGNFNAVLIDNKSAMFETTEYLINLGHKNIGYMDRIVDKSHSIERKKGYLLALEKYNLPCCEEFIFRGGFSSEDGYNAAHYFLNRKDKVSAILTSGDFAALGSIKYCYNNSLNVPKDISIVGFSDIPLCPYTMPSLTSIHYPVTEIVKASSEILLSKIEDPSLSEIKKIVLKAKLIIRDSVTSHC